MKKLATTFTNKKYQYTHMLLSPLTSFRPRLYEKKNLSPVDGSPSQPSQLEQN